MTKTNEHPTDSKTESTDRFSSDLETLKNSFTQMREDMTKILENTLGTGKSGAGMLRERASNAASDLQDYSSESVEKFGRKIGESPLLSAAIAVGIGFVLAKLFTSRK